jgi:hypothetical protein
MRQLLMPIGNMISSHKSGAWNLVGTAASKTNAFRGVEHRRGGIGDLKERVDLIEPLIKQGEPFSNSLHVVDCRLHGFDALGESIRCGNRLLAHKGYRCEAVACQLSNAPGVAGRRTLRSTACGHPALVVRPTARIGLVQWQFGSRRGVRLGRSVASKLCSAAFMSVTERLTNYLRNSCAKHVTWTCRHAMK